MGKIIILKKIKKHNVVTAEIKEKLLNDVVFMGLRSAIGVIFIVHGVSKFNTGFTDFLNNIGLPPEMQIPIALAELISGVLIIVGILSRISATMLSIIMLGAIFHVKNAQNLTGQGGYEMDLILLASVLVIMVVGPGRISLSHIVKKIPRSIH